MPTGMRQLPLIAMTGIQTADLRRYPADLNQHAWVYASRTNIITATAEVALR